METLEPRISLKKYGQRRISDFVAQELLYDHMRGRLDAERAEALQERLSNDGRLRHLAGQMQKAADYTAQLSRLRIPPENLTAIDEPDTYLSVLLQKTNFERWPLMVRWGVEASVVLSLFLIFLVVMPWNKLFELTISPQGRELILAEVVRQPRPEIEEPLYAAGEGVISFEDEGTPTAAAPTPPSPPPPVVSIPQVATPPTPTPVATPPPVVAKGPTPSEPAQTVNPSAGAGASTDSKKPAEGSLYRGTLAVTNVRVTSQKIREKIEEIGGRKAGQVELGWKNTPTSSYFHFTMPQAKYDELIDFLASYGAPKIQREKHPRVMPEGIVRLIITVEEAEK